MLSLWRRRGTTRIPLSLLEESWLVGRRILMLEPCRLAAGVCYRLWTQQEELTYELHSNPEIMEADLAPLAQELAASGARPDDLLWLDPPRPAAVSQATELLQQLGALSADGQITTHGRKMAEVGLHPRFSNMIVQAMSLANIPLGNPDQGQVLSALISGIRQEGIAILP